jgi:hypothetical protein
MWGAKNGTGSPHPLNGAVRREHAFCAIARRAESAHLLAILESPQQVSRYSGPVRRN